MQAWVPAARTSGPITWRVCAARTVGSIMGNAAVLIEVVGRAVGRIAGPRLLRLCRTA